jgi:GNAT superfamily N-acetyltransferase
MGAVPQVRRATIADAAAVARLAVEWGHPSTTTTTSACLERLTASPEHVAFVVEVDGTVTAWATGEVRFVIGSEPRVEITGLVVTSTLRRSGIGRLLVAQLEAWVREKGCGNLGMALLSRSRIVFDLKNQRMWLLPRAGTGE